MGIIIEICVQGSTKSPSRRPRQEGFDVRQVTFHSHLHEGKVLRQVLEQTCPKGML